MLTTDRLILEQQVFSYYQSRAEFRNILFVGCDADTARYHERYFSNSRFVTLEPKRTVRCVPAATCYWVYCKEASDSRAVVHSREVGQRLSSNPAAAAAAPGAPASARVALPAPRVNAESPASDCI